MIMENPQLRYTTGEAEHTVETPVHRYNTGEHELAMHYLNTRLRLSDEFENYVQYKDDELDLHLRVPEPLWERLMNDGYAFSYYPDHNHWNAWHGNNFTTDIEDMLDVDTRDGELRLCRTNARLRIFSEHDYDHVEYRTPQKKIRGLKLPGWAMAYLFNHDYPIEFLPTVEMDQSTKQWYDQHVLPHIESET